MDKKDIGLPVDTTELNRADRTDRDAGPLLGKPMPDTRDARALGAGALGRGGRIIPAPLYGGDPAGYDSLGVDGEYASYVD